MQVDIWTDIVCPWCFIGVTRFDGALRQYSGEVTVRLHPFQLDPEAPVPGIPALERYAKRFGSDAPRILERVQSEAAKDGIEMRFDRAVTANTFDAHRLVQYASRDGKERDLEQSLYSAYFTEGLDISDRNVLAERAASLGIDGDQALAYLNSNRGEEEVSEELAQAQQLGITGVPAFVFEQRFLVPGAVDTETFLRIFDQVTNG